MSAKKYSLFAVILFLALVLVPKAQANLIDSGSFESGNGIPYGDYNNKVASESTYNDITGWEVTNNQIKWVKAWWTAQEGELSIDLSGGRTDVSYPGTLEATSWNPTPGEIYTVTFYMSGNYIGAGGPGTTKSLEVRAGGQQTTIAYVNPGGWSVTDPKWEEKAWTFTASTAERLKFVSLENSNRGPIIDNVAVTLVPLPPTLLLLGTGLLGLGFLEWRKKRG